MVQSLIHMFDHQQEDLDEHASYVRLSSGGVNQTHTSHTNMTCTQSGMVTGAFFLMLCIRICLEAIGLNNNNILELQPHCKGIWERHRPVLFDNRSLAHHLT